jgi:hypothetical protein
MAEALGIQRTRASGYIRPVYWKEPCPARPTELADLHFGFLDLDRMRGISTRDAGKGAAPKKGRDAPLEGATILPAAVVPLLPGTSRRVLECYREDISWAIRFLENTTGLHYYPAPTLVVDRYTVAAVRAEETVDTPSISLQDQRMIADIGELLDRICLGFHVRSPWAGKNPDYDPAAVAHAAGLRPEAIERMRRLCEGSPRYWLVPSWWRASSTGGPALSDAATLKEAVLAVVDAALAASKAADAPIQVEHRLLEEHNAPWKRHLDTFGLQLLKGRYEACLSGRAADFKAALGAMRRYLASALSAYDDRYQPKDKPDERLLSAAIITAVLCEGLLGRNWLQGGNISLDRIILDEVSDGRWERARRELSEEQFPGLTDRTNFIEFGRAFFGKLKEVLDRRAHEADNPVINIGYAISHDVWLRLRQAGLVDKLQLGPEQVARTAHGDLELTGRLSDIAVAVAKAWQTVEDLLGRGMSSPASRFFVANVPTYGIFAPASATGADAQLRQLADELSLPHALTLPGSHRVLLCADALDDFATRLASEGGGLNAARLFVRSVVVHEHFHALVETAPDPNGAAPRGPGFRKHWKDASSVNEALAAWMQLHMARDKPELLQLVKDYIAFGDFPDWPYAGAAYVEGVFESDGLKGVRELVELLRSDPPKAAARLAALNSRKEDNGSRAAGSAKTGLFRRLLGGKNS